MTKIPINNKSKKILSNETKLRIKENHWSKNLLIKEATKEKIRIARAKQIMKPLSEEHKRKFCYANRSRKRLDLSEYNKKNKTGKLMGDLNPSKRFEVRQKISNKLKGRIFDDDWKRKISENKKRFFRNNPEAKLKMREIGAMAISPNKDTSIEIKIQNFLKELGYDFFTHQYIKEIKHPYRCDILIPSLNLVIECDGDYWHKYPIGREIDKIRTRELLEKGFNVLRLWEHEIRKVDINIFKKKLEDYND